MNLHTPRNEMLLTETEHHAVERYQRRIVELEAQIVDLRNIALMLERTLNDERDKGGDRSG